MAGYMGFGMQSWLYKKKPRKPFTKRGKLPSYTALPKYSREFTIKPKSKENSKLVGAITIGIILCFICLGFIYEKKFTNYSNEYSKSIEAFNKKKDHEAYIYLISKATEELKRGQTLKAYDKLKIAETIYPNDYQQKHLMKETLSILCTKDKNYCIDLDKYLSEN